LRVTVHVGGFFRAAGPAGNRTTGQALVVIIGLDAMLVPATVAASSCDLRDCFHVPIGAG
jgi:hypothetical protein